VREAPAEPVEAPSNNNIPRSNHFKQHIECGAAHTRARHTLIAEDLLASRSYKRIDLQREALVIG